VALAATPTAASPPPPRTAALLAAAGALALLAGARGTLPRARIAPVRQCRRRDAQRGGCESFGVSRGSLVAMSALEKRKSDVPEDLDWNNVSQEWEVDCFSRPIMREGKKLWELCVTDANGIYRRVAQMKPSRVNSVVVQKLLMIFIDESKVKPRSIRFFRKVMANMLTVAMSAIQNEVKYMDKLKIIPSRNCHMLRLWLNYRERQVYPKMEGFVLTAKRKSTSVSANVLTMPYENLPQRLKFYRYAFSAIPLGSLARVKPGQLPGKLCRIPPGISDTTLVHGIMILTERADFISTVLKQMELAAVRVSPDTNELLMDLELDTTYRIEKVAQEEKESMLQFERAKRSMGGLHFVAIHNPVSGGEPNLPIEADNDVGGDGCITGLWLCIDYAPQELG